MYKNYSSGYFKVPSVGAGTANTEFEVLTGMNMRFFGPGEYPYKTVVKNQPCESAATALSALGYGTHGLHNNGGNFYSRAKVYDHMGFDSFTSKEFMNILQLNAKWKGQGRCSGRQYYGSYGYDRAAGFRIYRQCAGTWRLPGGAVD